MRWCDEAMKRMNDDVGKRHDRWTPIYIPFPFNGRTFSVIPALAFEFSNNVGVFTEKSKKENTTRTSALLAIPLREKLRRNEVIIPMTNCQACSRVIGWVRRTGTGPNLQKQISSVSNGRLDTDMGSTSLENDKWKTLGC
jgi:hypothetical protein